LIISVINPRHKYEAESMAVWLVNSKRLSVISSSAIAAALFYVN
jgi:hypothetical protein